MDFDKVKPLYYASKEKSKLIFRYLQLSNISVSKTQTANDLKTHPNTITKYLKALVSINLMHREKIENNNLYFLY